MKSLIKKLSLRLPIALGAQLLVATAVLGMCIPFFPPSREVLPADNTKTLIVYQNGVQHLIVQPEFRGALQDFGLVMPAPSLPDVNEAPKDLFTKLEDYTNPIREFDDFGLRDSVGLAAESEDSEQKVTVIDRKDVGTYTATILNATDATELNKWLEDNGYESNSLKDEVMQYYIDQGGYFVALKVNMSAVDEDTFDQTPIPEPIPLDDRVSSGELGELTIAPTWPDSIPSSFLDPIDISYETDAPRLPTRLLAAMPETLNYTVYTLSAEPYIIPGGDVQHAGKISLSDALFSEAKVLLDYNPNGQWLVRNYIQINPENANEDLFLTRVADAGSSTVRIGNPAINVNANLWNSNTGITRSDCVVEPARYDEDTFEFIPAILGDVDDCDFGYSFDLGIGDAKDHAGFPLLMIVRTALVIIVGALLYWRWRAYLKKGPAGLLPRPDKAFMTGLRWLDHRLGHRILGKKNGQLPSHTLALRNMLLVVVGWLVTNWLVHYIDDNFFNWSIDLDRDVWVMLAAIPLLFTAGLTIFITPTQLWGEKNKQRFWNYWVSLIVLIVLVWLVISAFN